VGVVVTLARAKHERLLRIILQIRLNAKRDRRAQGDLRKTTRYDVGRRARAFHELSTGATRGKNLPDPGDKRPGREHRSPDTHGNGDGVRLGIVTGLLPGVPRVEHLGDGSGEAGQEDNYR
jgi:hypothetical protein